MRKIDLSLQKSFSLTNDTEKISCFVYVNNVDFATKVFKQKNIKVENTYKFLNLLLLSTTKQNIFNLQSLPFVNYITKSTKVLTLVNVAKNILGVDKINYYGKDVVVCVIDTGVCNHFDFVLGKNRIVKFVDLVNNKQTPYDDNGHGTFVSGVLMGSGLMSFGKYKGFASCSSLISVKALDKNGEANANKILQAMEWVYNNYKTYNIKVVCMSFGSEPLGKNDPIKLGAEKLWKKGIVVVSAAGNSGPNFQTIKSPGISSKIITVGGFDDKRNLGCIKKENFEIADFSSRGPAYSKIKPDMVAPSVNITSCGLNNNYITLSGTSVAAPMVAGICAMIINKYKNLSPDQIKNLLLSSCKSITKNFNMEGMGYPFIN